VPSFLFLLYTLINSAVAMHNKQTTTIKKRNNDCYGMGFASGMKPVYRNLLGTKAGGSVRG
jgi:hypothetical protein